MASVGACSVGPHSRLLMQVAGEGHMSCPNNSQVNAKTAFLNSKMVCGAQ